jgi:hypothetical protein
MMCSSSPHGAFMEHLFRLSPSWSIFSVPAHGGEGRHTAPAQSLAGRDLIFARSLYNVSEHKRCLKVQRLLMVSVRVKHTF